jgi:hypothetical protein
MQYRIGHTSVSRWLQSPAHPGSSLADFSTLKMEAIRSSESSVQPRSTRRHIPEDGILHSHCRENLKSYRFYVVSWKDGMGAIKIIQQITAVLLHYSNSTQDTMLPKWVRGDYTELKRNVRKL